MLDAVWLQAAAREAECLRQEREAQRKQYEGQQVQAAGSDGGTGCGCGASHRLPSPLGILQLLVLLPQLARWPAGTRT